MLERAAGCLELAGQRVLRSRQNPVRSRRTLPPTFWHHGSGDIDAVVPFHRFRRKGSLTQDSIVPRRKEGQHNVELVFLDFLYPSQTVETLQRLSKQRPKSFRNGRRRKSAEQASRSYSTASRQQISQGQYDQGPVAEQSHASSGVSPDSSNYNVDNLDQKEALSILMTILEARPGYWEFHQVWNLYRQAGSPISANSLLLAYLSNSNLPEDIRRALEAFEETPTNMKNAEDYRLAILMYLKSGQRDLAIETCRETVSRNIGALCWIFLFRQFLEGARWTEAIKLWSIRPQSDDDQNLIKAEFQRLPSLPLLVIGLASSLDTNDLSPGAKSMAIELLFWVTESQDLMFDLTTSQMLEMFRIYSNIGLLRKHHYYRAIISLSDSGSRRKYVQAVYLYRNLLFLLREVKPPQSILGLLLRNACDFESKSTINFFLEQFQQWHGAPSPRAYQVALSAYANMGDVEGLRSLFREYCRLFGQPKDQAFLSPLLLVHARLGQIEETQEQFEQLSHVYKVQPNTICWNIVLLAHCQADNLDGALRHVHQMLDQGIKPDAYTFGTLMGIFANRGDVNALRKVFGSAYKKGFRGNAPMIDSLVQSLCNNQEIRRAESVVRAALHMKLEGSLTRMWNILISVHAFRGDLESVIRLQDEMKQHNVPWDAMTYANLMQSLVTVGKTDAARQILRQVHGEGSIDVTIFHYAILLNGYSRENNRDMMTVIYHEVLERYPASGFGPRLSHLQKLAMIDIQRFEEGPGRDSESKFELPNARRFFEELVNEVDFSEYASKTPHPGTRKRSLREAYPSVYFEFIIGLYGTRGSYGKVEAMFDQYMEKKQRFSSGANVNNPPPIALLSSLMTAQLRAHLHYELEDNFRRALIRATQMARQTDIENVSLATDPAGNSTPPPLAPSVPSNSDALPPILESAQAKDPFTTDNTQASILHHRRFLLSRPFTLYMRSVAQSQGIPAVESAIAEFTARGFALSTYNMSAYVQLLATSLEPRDQLKAYTVFEQHFMPNFPGWKLLTRGYTLGPGENRDAMTDADADTHSRRNNWLNKRERRIMASLTDPGHFQPTYVTVTYLGAAMIDFHERSKLDGGVELSQLRESAPGTYEIIMNTPHVKDKMQGVMLRERAPLPEDRRYFRTGKVRTEGALVRNVTDRGSRRREPTVKPNPADIAAYGLWLDMTRHTTADLNEISEAEPELEELDVSELQSHVTAPYIDNP